MREEKTELRRRVLAAIEALSPDERTARSERAQDRMIELPEFQCARAVFAYVADDTEADTRRIVAAALAAGKRVALPRVDVVSKAMSPREIRDPRSDLESGAFGIPAPRANCPEIPLAELDLVLVPGRVFDARGRRMGRGGGFYDRLLAAPELRAAIVALAFDCQVVDEVPHEPHDKPVAAIVTESRVIRAPNP
ncbi:MAG: 5-formyltetrahydrofolate cyclo-ligase [Planctomycetota bacterium]